MFKRAHLLRILLLILCGCGVQSQRISETQCRETYSSIITPPTSQNSDPYNSLGFGKVPTDPGEFPYMTALGWQNEEGGYKFFCGGVLIAPEYVLTAAHCTKNSQGDPPQIVRIGGASLIDSTVENVSVADIQVHREYQPIQVYNDIAILKLASPSSQPPVCLWQTPEISQSEVTAIGYGKTSFEGSASDDLLKVNLDIVSIDDCRKSIGPTRKLEDGIIDSQICTGDTENVKDTCQGDAGGPLLVKITDDDKEIPYVVGIISFGRSCASGSPSVSTRVSSYLDWIESVVWP